MTTIKRENLGTIDFSDIADSCIEAREIHPGVHLLDYLEEHQTSQYRLAKSVNVPPRRINEIVLGKRSITADTALRLGIFFDTTPAFWMNLQTAYDLDAATFCAKDLAQVVAQCSDSR